MVVLMRKTLQVKTPHIGSIHRQDHMLRLFFIKGRLSLMFKKQVSHNG